MRVVVKQTHSAHVLAFSEVTWNKDITIEHMLGYSLCY